MTSMTGARTIGLALVRPTEIMSAEPFYHEFIAGIERTVRPDGYSVLVNVLATRDAEIETYERWARDSEVRGVLIMDIALDDGRPAFLEELGLPSVVVGPPAAATGDRAVWTNDDVAMKDAVEYLAALGHRHLAHVTGPSSLLHTRIRNEAFIATCEALGVAHATISGDYSRESGERAMNRLLQSEDAPSAAILDSDVMALGALDSARERGVPVPDRLSIVAWDDSAQCQLSEPPLSAVSHDVQLIGSLAGLELLAEIRGEVGGGPVSAPVSIVSRASTASPPAV